MELYFMISLSGTYVDDIHFISKVNLYAVAMKISGRINWGILSFLVLLSINEEQFKIIVRSCLLFVIKTSEYITIFIYTITPRHILCSRPQILYLNFLLANKFPFLFGLLMFQWLTVNFWAFKY